MSRYEIREDAIPDEESDEETPIYDVYEVYEDGGDSGCLESFYDRAEAERYVEELKRDNAEDGAEHIATIGIPGREVIYWNDKLKSDDLDYSALGWGEYETVAKWTVRFDDGCEADIKVNSNTAEDGDCYAEAVLFDREGHQLAYTADPSDEVDGTWYLYVDANDGACDQYTVIVVPQGD